MQVTVRGFGLALAAGAAMFAAGAGVAQAQQSTPTPTPRPAPTRTPQIITLPGAENFDLSAPNGRPRPRPTATPSPTPAASSTPRVTPPPVRATPTPAPSARPTPTATATPTRQAPASTPTPSATPTPEPSPVEAAPVAPEVVAPAPTPQPSDTPVSEPAPAPAEDGIPWLWIAIAAGAIVAIALGLFLARRRRAERWDAPEPIAEPIAPPPPRPTPAHPAPAPAPQKPAPAPVPAAPPAPAPAPRPAQVIRRATPNLSDEPFAVELRPIEMGLLEGRAELSFELGLVNNTAQSAEDIRLSLVIISTSPTQDSIIQTFHRAPTVTPATEPFNMAGRASIRLPGKLTLPGDRIHVVQVASRPMFVPLIMVDLRWRGGLSLRRFAADFMVGTAGQAGKVGPIWLDRGGPAKQLGLAASRYFPRPAASEPK